MAKSSKYKDLTQNTILFTISNFGAKIISFLLVPLYTYVLSTKDYGTVDLMTTTSQLLIPLLTLNIQDAVLRFALDDEYNPNRIIGAAVKLVCLSSLLLAIALFVIRLSGVTGLDNQYLIFLFFSFLLGVLNNCFSMYLKAKNRVKILTIAGLINTFLACLFNILLLLVIKMGVTGYLVANSLGLAIAVSIMYIAGGIYKEVNYGNSKYLLKRMIPYSLPLVANSLAWWLNNASDRYILTYFCGTAINGIYAVSYKIPTILSTVQSIFYNAWSISAITEFDKDDEDGFIGNVYTLYSAASIIGCSLLLLGNIFIARILYSKDFFTAWRFVPPLLIGTVFNGIALFEGCIFTAVKKTKEVSQTTILGAIINTALNFVLIPFTGAMGAAIATMVGYICIWVIRTFQVRKIVTMKINWKIQILSMLLLMAQLIFSASKNLYWIQVPFVVLIIWSQRTFISKICKRVLYKINSRGRRV